MDTHTPPYRILSLLFLYSHFYSLPSFFICHFLEFAGCKPMKTTKVSVAGKSNLTVNFEEELWIPVWYCLKKLRYPKQYLYPFLSLRCFRLYSWYPIHVYPVLLHTCFTIPSSPCLLCLLRLLNISIRITFLILFFRLLYNMKGFHLCVNEQQWRLWIENLAGEI